MKHIFPFKIFEKVDLSVAKEATRIFLETGGKSRYDKYFKGQDRIYYDFLEKDQDSPTREDIKNVLGENGFEILNYLDGTCTKKGDTKNIFKIQKILNRFKREDLRNKMDTDPIRASSTKGTKKVVISRHGVDLAGASTGRDWVSCRQIHVETRGWQRHYVFDGIKGGDLTAYLIESDDLNIQKPLARIAITPYFRDLENDPDDILLYPNSEMVYGNYGREDFLEFVREKCLEISRSINPKLGKSGDFYYINPLCHTDNFRKINLSTSERSLRSFNSKNYTPGFHYVDTSEFDPKNIFSKIISEEFSKDETDLLYNILVNLKSKGTHILDALEIPDDKISEFIKKDTGLFNSYLRSLLPDDIYKISDQKAKIILQSFREIIPPNIFNRFKIAAHSEGIPKWIVKKAELFGML